MTDGPGWETLAAIPPTPPRRIAHVIQIRDYDPTERLADNEYQDTLLTYSVFADATKMQATLEADPLGDVNKIVRLWRINRDGTRTQLGPAVLHPAAARARLKVGTGRDYRGQLYRNESPWFSIFGGAVWYVEVDGKRVIEVDHLAALEPYPPPPRPPLRRRVRAAVKRRARGLADAIAGQLGYTRTGECDCEW
jgi:hypothetical protein